MLPEEILAVLIRANLLVRHNPYQPTDLIGPLLDALAEKYPNPKAQRYYLNCILSAICIPEQYHYYFLNNAIQKIRIQIDKAYLAQQHLLEARELLATLPKAQPHQKLAHQKIYEALSHLSRHAAILEAVKSLRICSGEHATCDTKDCSNSWITPVGNKKGGLAHLCEDCLLTFSTENIGELADSQI